MNLFVSEFVRMILFFLLFLLFKNEMNLKEKLTKMGENKLNIRMFSDQNYYDWNRKRI